MANLNMDSIFLLGEGERGSFLHHVMEAFNCTYICLWSYWPHPSNYLLCLEGFYLERRANQPSTSSGTSLAQRLFDEYRKAAFDVDKGTVPGLAFKTRLPYMELKSADLQRLASIENQLQFYQEAGIKIAVFMGCNAGEIELGMSNDPQINLEMELKNLFAEDFSRQVAPGAALPTDQTRPSSSSSSLRSLSVDSSEYSSLLFNIPSTAYVPEAAKEAVGEQTMGSISVPPLSSPNSPTQPTVQALSQIRNIQFPSIEIENAALTKAMLAVITSSSSSSSRQSEQNVPPNYQLPQRPPAFKRYRPVALPPRPQAGAAATRRANMFRRAITFYRRLSLMQQQEQAGQGSRPTSTQLHHMFSERRRREKLNESFQALRSLLPSGTKKDKASVLANTTEYLASLKAQVEELSKRNQILEAQLLPRQEEAKAKEAGGLATVSSTSTESVQVRTMHVAASTSEARLVDLQVAVLRGQCSVLDLVICILEFLKHVEDVSVVSMEANTTMVESTSMNRVMFRLRIEGGEWDEAAFQEAVRRVVDDMAQRQLDPPTS